MSIMVQESCNVVRLIVDVMVNTTVHVWWRYLKKLAMQDNFFYEAMPFDHRYVLMFHRFAFVLYMSTLTYSEPLP